MAFYVEVMCNVRKQWPSAPEYSGKLHNRCLSDDNENPQGRTLREAATEARRFGWRVTGRWACCRMCLEVLPGEAP